jgi:hypothetical protein
MSILFLTLLFLLAAVPYWERLRAFLIRDHGAEVGSFMGGYFGAIFALLGAVLFYAALKSQTRSAQLQSFENKYVELIKIHRDNVAEVDLAGASGRKLFVLLLRELRCLLVIVRKIAATSGQQLSNENIMHVAYYCLFYGVGPNSSRMLRASLSKFDAAFVDALERELDVDETKKKIQEERNLGYKPFEGHQSRLGHYYRHLYQMIKYVDSQPIDAGKKYEYMKTIRAQLSTHEQAMLLVNSRTPIGQNWWTKEFIVRYRLVQNIPEDFFLQSEIDMSKLFHPYYFEWEEA